MVGLRGSNGMGATSPAGQLFNLSASDAELFKDACCAILADHGLDGRALFQGLSAGEQLGAALGLSPEVEEHLYERAHRWFAVGRPERAEPLFRALCVSAGDDADYWIGLGVCLRLCDDTDGAALAFATAARLRPDWAVPAFHAAELALRSGDIQAASTLLERFHALQTPGTPEGMATEAKKLVQAISFRQETAARAGAR